MLDQGGSINWNERRLSRRAALGGAAAAAIAMRVSPDAAQARASSRPATITSAALGRGGVPMTPAAVAAIARQIGDGEPVAIVDLAAVDHNCDRLLAWSAEHGIAWRPAYKTLR